MRTKAVNVWKVTHITDEGAVSAVASGEKAVSYRVGRYVSANPSYDKRLFVFSTKKSAQRFKRDWHGNYVIWKARAKNRRELPVGWGLFPVGSMAFEKVMLVKRTTK